MPWIIAVLAVLAAAGAWVYASLDDKSGPAAAISNLVGPTEAPPFDRAQGQCDALKLGTSIKDGGKTLIVEVRGRKSLTGMSVDELECVFNALEMPESVRAQIWDTRALDGRQSATWAGYSASWTYHPDDGLDAIATATS